MKNFFVAIATLCCAMSLAQANGIVASSAGSPHSTGNAPAAPLDVLYDQMGSDSTIATVSQDFETANDTYDDQGADDFIVPPAESWIIDGVDVAGQYFNGVGPADSFAVYFYTDAAGLPGTLVDSRLAQPYTNGASASIALTSPIVLGAGSYWVSVQAKMDLTVGGEWGWDNRTVQSGAVAAWRNPGNGFVTGCTFWGANNVCIPTAGGPDFVFRLNGTIGNVVGTFPPDENFDENPAPLLPAGWTTAATGSGVAWATTTTFADTAPNAAFAPDVAGVSDMTLDSPSFTPAAGQELSFKHKYALENGFDGAVLEISTDGGATFQDILDAGGSFLSGGYNGTISTSFSSPITGRGAWTGASPGFVTTQVQLPPAAVGQPTMLRFRTADDTSVAATGWWVDTVRVGTPPPPDAIFCSGFEIDEDGSCDNGGVPGPWTTGTTGPSARYRAGGTSDGTNVYVFGGGDDVGNYFADAWKWDAASETWTQLADMPTAKQNIQGSYLDGRIYVPGGYAAGVQIAENAIYLVGTDTWTIGAPMPTARDTVTAAYDGKIYAFGGNLGATYSNRLDIYDPFADSWTQGADFPVNISYGRAVTVGNYIYYVGGIVDGATTTADVWRYDPASDSYTAKASLQTARTSEELMADGDRIYAVNGGGASFFNGIPLAQTVEIYDITADTWSYGDPTLTTAAGSAGGLAGGKLMIMGGVDTTGGITVYDQVQVSTLVPE